MQEGAHSQVGVLLLHTPGEVVHSLVGEGLQHILVEEELTLAEEGHIPVGEGHILVVEERIPAVEGHILVVEGHTLGVGAAVDNLVVVVVLTC